MTICTQYYFVVQTQTLFEQHNSHYFRGVCLYAMLTGKLPFNPSPTANLPDLHKLIMNGVDIPNYLSEGNVIYSDMLASSLLSRSQYDTHAIK